MFLVTARINFESYPEKLLGRHLVSILAQLDLGLVLQVTSSLIEIHCLQFSELSPEHYPTEL